MLSLQEAKKERSEPGKGCPAAWFISQPHTCSCLAPHAPGWLHLCAVGKHCHTLSYSSPYPDLGHHLHAVSLNPNHLCICKARLHPSPNAVMMEAAVIQMQLSWGRGRAIYPGAGECQHLACASQRRRNPQNKSWAGIWKIVLSLQ